MNRISTSNTIETKIVKLQHALKLSTKASVMRIAIGLSIREKTDPRKDSAPEDLDSAGSIYLVNTIIGEYEDIYRLMLGMQLKSALDDAHFLTLLKAHIARGVKFLDEEYRLNGSGDRVIAMLMGLLKEK